MYSDAKLSELKQEILRLLKEDEEFRYAIAGLLGLNTIINELKSLKEAILENSKDIKKLQEAIVEHSRDIKEMQEVIAEHSKTIKELQKTVVEHSKAIRELQQVVVEHSKAIKELQEVITEHSRVIAEHSKAIKELQQVVAEYSRVIAEHSKAIKELQEVVVEHSKAIKGLQEIVAEHSRDIKELQKTVAEHSKTIAEHSKAIKELQEEMIRFRASVYAIGNRYGVVTEEAFRSAISYLVEDLLKEYRVEKWVYYDGRGAVYGAPSVIEMDILVKDREHILVEYKAHVDRSDVAEFERIAKLYEEVVGVKPRKLIVGASVTEKAFELAKSLGIEVRAGNIYKK